MTNYLIPCPHCNEVIDIGDRFTRSKTYKKETIQNYNKGYLKGASDEHNKIIEIINDFDFEKFKDCNELVNTLIQKIKRR